MCCKITATVGRQTNGHTSAARRVRAAPHAYLATTQAPDARGSVTPAYNALKRTFTSGIVSSADTVVFFVLRREPVLRACLCSTEENILVASSTFYEQKKTCFIELLHKDKLKRVGASPSTSVQAVGFPCVLRRRFCGHRRCTCAASRPYTTVLYHVIMSYYLMLGEQRLDATAGCSNAYTEMDVYRCNVWRLPSTALAAGSVTKASA